MARRKVVRAKNRRTGKGVTLTSTKAAEMFIGGLCGCMLVADKIGLKASVGGALMSALSIALPDLPLKGVVAAYHKIGGEMPIEMGAAVLGATARKTRRKAKPKRRRP